MSDPEELDELRGRLEEVEQTPIDERPALLEEANEALVRALASLEEA